MSHGNRAMGHRVDPLLFTGTSHALDRIHKAILHDFHDAESQRLLVVQWKPGFLGLVS